MTDTTIIVVKQWIDDNYKNMFLSKYNINIFWYDKAELAYHAYIRSSIDAIYACEIINTASDLTFQYTAKLSLTLDSIVCVDGIIFYMSSPNFFVDLKEFIDNKLKLH